MNNDNTDLDDARSDSEMSKLSRRTAMGILTGLGVLTATDTAAASTNNNHDHLGQRWEGSSGPWAFRVDNSTSNPAIYGSSDASGGIGIYGRNFAGSGNARGLVGRTDSTAGIALDGVAAATSGENTGLRGASQSDEGTGVLGESRANSGTTYGVRGTVDSSDGYGLYTPDDAKIDGTVEVLGDIEVSGVKNFVQTVSSDAGPKQVKYTSVEAGEPQTEHSDVVEMEDGVAVVELPDHFGMVTSGDERLAVQVTPYCDDPVQPQVTDRSTDRIVVKDFSDGPDEYSFAYTVKGVRQGFEDQQVVSDSS